MSAGLLALLDDIAVLAKMAAASVDDVAAAAGRASAKAAGVVVDDTAVTPRYVQGLDPKRELPIIWRITKGSLRNKLLFILPAILLLSQFVPWLLTPILMLGGLYLSYEGAEKLWEKVSGHGEEATPAIAQGEDAEDKVVSNAVRTDLILSAEIMVISLNEVAAEGFWSRLAILIVVAIAITLVVYGVVGLIIKMDDIGLRIAERDSSAAQKFGRGLVKGMHVLLRVLSVVGVAAMLWVGGHILLVGTDTLGWHTPYGFVHHLEEAVHGGFLGWLINTVASAIIGVVVGAIAVAVMHVLPFGKKKAAEHAEEEPADAPPAAAPSADQHPTPEQSADKP